jgi:hypothetical protein
MTESLLRPLIVLAIGGTTLLSAEPAPADNGMFDLCNQWLSGACETWDDEQARIACNGFCPNWWAYLCDGDGHFFCVSNPS